MIINVSGRTDIVNYYTPWFINRLKEGFVYTRNPYNPHHITKYTLSNSVVDAIVFCSKNYESILKYMPSIIEKYPVYCFYTITCYEDDIESNVVNIDESIKTLKKLSSIVGKNRISWRYDPILLTEKYTINDIVESFEYMTEELHEYVNNCIFSFVDMYKKVNRNMPEIIECDMDDENQILKKISQIAGNHNMILQSCAVNNKYENYGIKKSGCVTREILEDSNNIKFNNIKTAPKRKGCNCISWRDIGEYNTCPNGCKYCYANKNPKIAKIKYKQHDPTSPLLIGHVTKKDKIIDANQSTQLIKDQKQQTLF